MRTTDEQIGKNLQRLRGELSQKDLAVAMRKAGYKWSQATVWSVEQGERPLRLTEAEELARILDVGTHMLTTSDQELAEILMTRAIHDLMEEIDEKSQELYARQRRLALTMSPEDTDDYFVRVTAADVALQGLFKALKDEETHKALIEFSQDESDDIDESDVPEGYELVRSLEEARPHYKTFLEVVRAQLSQRKPWMDSDEQRPEPVQGETDGEYPEAT